MLSILPLCRLWGLAAALAALAATGCGNGAEPASVSGTVTLNGQPPKISGLTISFVDAAGQTVAVAVAEDGKYSASTLTSGAVRIGFYDVGSLPRGNNTPDTYDNIDPRAAREKATAGKAKPAGPRIPERLMDPLKSGVQTALKPGANTFDFDIK